MTIAIRVLAGRDSIAELTSLLHAAYAPLWELGFNYTAVDQSEDVTWRRIANGECYVAVDGEMMVGTILFRRHPRGCSWYEQPHVGAIHQLAVRPDFQKCGVGTKLMRFVESRAIAAGASELALDTAEGADHLVGWYTRMGFRQVAIEQWPGKTYRSLILSKELPARAPSR